MKSEFHLENPEELSEPEACNPICPANFEKKVHIKLYIIHFILFLYHYISHADSFVQILPV